ncbi:hypothetical protein NEOLEDRAFT_505819 [Neolentinus lepideus HHB14362 ss-1]|uniref:Uncharacterized protein n=1 Tax=Neolentinus lepideus HHB14362 ss-1 TaxID=1314782 RepID=A0A165RJK6_9AGAM|nr:hypothetical protein NEOLEDRAFT_505819 [Neolentinus lepideus HHB14362 ss-1]
MFSRVYARDFGCASLEGRSTGPRSGPSLVRTSSKLVTLDEETVQALTHVQYSPLSKMALKSTFHCHDVCQPGDPIARLSSINLLHFHYAPKHAICLCSTSSSIVSLDVHVPKVGSILTTKTKDPSKVQWFHLPGLVGSCVSVADSATSTQLGDSHGICPSSSIHALHPFPSSLRI